MWPEHARPPSLVLSTAMRTAATMAMVAVRAVASGGDKDNASGGAHGDGTRRVRGRGEELGKLGCTGGLRDQRVADEHCIGSPANLAVYEKALRSFGPRLQCRRGPGASIRVRARVSRGPKLSPRALP